MLTVSFLTLGSTVWETIYQPHQLGTPTAQAYADQLTLVDFF